MEQRTDDCLASGEAVLVGRVGLQPGAIETVWFGLCAAGFNYHRQNLRELYADKAALSSWPDADDVDKEANENDIRREGSRLTTKTLFASAGLVSMFLPPRAVQAYELTTQIVIILLICAVVALDVDAVLSRRSRRRQMELLTTMVERKRKRRELLEVKFRPLFEAAAEQASADGRVLIHDINGDLSIIIGAVTLLRMMSLSDDAMALLCDIEDATDGIIADSGELRTLVYGLSVQSLSPEVQDGPNPSAGPSGATDQSEVHPGASGDPAGTSGLSDPPA
jgi:hypothetical protein